MNECDVFMQALDIEDPQARRTFLDEACQDDRELRRRINRLLESHGQAGSLLEHPVVQPLATEFFDGAETRDGSTEKNTVPQREKSSLDFLEPSQDPQSLGRLGKYEILDVIGRGGMGIVLKGHDTKLHRVVAVKVLAPELAPNVTARKRFEKEAQAAAAVSHDHVVTIFEVENNVEDRTKRLPHLVMEFIDGQSLQQKIENHGPLELKEILRIGVSTRLICTDSAVSALRIMTPALVQSCRCCTLSTFATMVPSPLSLFQAK